MVVRMLWEHVAWVRFPALRQICAGNRMGKGSGKRKFSRSGSWKPLGFQAQSRHIGETSSETSQHSDKYLKSLGIE